MMWILKVVTARLGMREGFLYQGVIEDVWDPKVQTDCKCPILL